MVKCRHNCPSCCEYFSLIYSVKNKKLIVTEITLLRFKKSDYSHVLN